MTACWLQHRPKLVPYAAVQQGHGVKENVSLPLMTLISVEWGSRFASQLAVGQREERVLNFVCAGPSRDYRLPPEKRVR